MFPEYVHCGLPSPVVLWVLVDNCPRPRARCAVVMGETAGVVRAADCFPFLHQVCCPDNSFVRRQEPIYLQCTIYSLVFDK